MLLLRNQYHNHYYLMRSSLTLLIFYLTVSEPLSTTPPTHSLRSTTTEIDHFDRDHPVNLTCIQSTPNTINASWSLPNHENQTELENFILYYYRSKYAKDQKMHRREILEKDVTSYLIKGLKPGSSYSFQVIANYSMGHQPHSIIYTIKTVGYGEDRPCDCNRIGSKENTVCNNVTGQCVCRDKKTTFGRQCDRCVEGYIWTNLTGCHPCSCSKKRSRNTCYVDQYGGVRCHCLGNYGGDKCEHCALNFYQQTDRCLPCQCNNNTKPALRACDIKSGICIACQYNTTGDHCEKCLDGYEGDPPSGRSCIKYVSAGDMAAGHTWDGGSVGAVFHRNLGAIIGGCVGALLFVLLIVAVVVYRRWWRWRRRPLQFWTVQLKEDRERVSFSADHPAYQHVDGSPMPDDSPFSDQAGRAGWTPELKLVTGRSAQPRTHSRGGYNPYHSLQET